MTNHIINGHYMFGNTFIQPEMPMYDRIVHHNMAPVNRPMPPYPDIKYKPIHPNGNKYACYLGYEDSANKIDTPYEDSNNENNCECNDCLLNENGIIRDPLMFNIVNIETSVIKTLKVKLYGVTREQDKTIEMKVGNRYAVTYITEHGLIVSVGKLEVISDSIPDTCTRYINSNNLAAASSAYIGMDCSVDYNSDKRKIYIGTIRYIQELKEDEEIVVEEEKSIKDKLEELLTAIEKGELVFCNICKNNNEDDTITEEPDNNEDSEDNNVIVNP